LLIKKTYIREFGGDPSAVTISGESAGGGSVMLMDMGEFNLGTGHSLEIQLTRVQRMADLLETPYFETALLPLHIFPSNTTTTIGCLLKHIMLSQLRLDAH
tara:strand:- start:7334 stop:7636 length:303 start_codon:yes stop_codon:yes gene_type:complete